MIIYRLFVTDFKRILADSFTLFMYFSPWLTAIAVLFLWDYLTENHSEWPLDDYRVLVSICVSLMVSLNMGIVLGFQLLEEKEQGVFKAISVTVLNQNYYLFYRFLLFILLSIVLGYISYTILDLVDVNTWHLLCVLVFASLQVPIQALVISSFTKNTIEGFAMMKATGFMLLVPLLVTHFYPDAFWSWLAAILPYYWVIKTYHYLVAENPTGFYLCLSVGVGYQLILIVILKHYYCRNALN